MILYFGCGEYSPNYEFIMLNNIRYDSYYFKI